MDYGIFYVNFYEIPIKIIPGAMRTAYNATKPKNCIIYNIY